MEQDDSAANQAILGLRLANKTAEVTAHYVNPTTLFSGRTDALR